MRPRIIPILLIDQRRLVKTIGFRNPNYLGDPINTIRLFNELEVDEIIVLDITRKTNEIDFEYLKTLTTECFMPFTYGGKINRLKDISNLLKIGIEKVSINSKGLQSPNFLSEAVKEFGGSTIVASIDVKKSFLGNYKIYSSNGKKKQPVSVTDWIQRCCDMGVGEILINSIDRDGKMVGYDFELISKITNLNNVPIVIAGGAKNLKDHKIAKEKYNISGTAAGSMFVYHNRKESILINYPSRNEINKVFSNQ